MLEGPVTIGYGLTYHQFVHFSVFLLLFFDTVLYETLFSSDLDFVWLCLGCSSTPIALTSL